VVHLKNPLGFYAISFKGQEIENGIDTVVLVDYHPREKNFSAINNTVLTTR
jgi:hypothetical protein